MRWWNISAEAGAPTPLDQVCWQQSVWFLFSSDTTITWGCQGTHTCWHPRARLHHWCRVMRGSSWWTWCKYPRTRHCFHSAGSAQALCVNPPSAHTNTIGTLRPVQSPPTLKKNSARVSVQQPCRATNTGISPLKKCWSNVKSSAGKTQVTNFTGECN